MKEKVVKWTLFGSMIMLICLVSGIGCSTDGKKPTADAKGSLEAPVNQGESSASERMSKELSSEKPVAGDTGAAQERPATQADASSSDYASFEVAPDKNQGPLNCSPNTTRPDVKGVGKAIAFGVYLATQPACLRPCSTCVYSKDNGNDCSQECTQDSDCKSRYRCLGCYGTKACVQVCKTKADCDAGEQCVSGVCLWET